MAELLFSGKLFHYEDKIFTFEEVIHLNVHILSSEALGVLAKELLELDKYRATILRHRKGSPLITRIQ